MKYIFQIFCQNTISKSKLKIGFLNFVLLEFAKSMLKILASLL